MAMNRMPSLRPLTSGRLPYNLPTFPERVLTRLLNLAILNLKETLLMHVMADKEFAP